MLGDGCEFVNRFGHLPRIYTTSQSFNALKDAQGLVEGNTALLNCIR